MAAATRDTQEVLRGYIVREVPEGGGVINNDATAEQYLRAIQLLTEPKTVTFTDARTANGGLGSWQLDTHGFCIIRPPEPVDFSDANRKQIKEEYYPRLAEIAKEHAGARRGYVFNHLLRSEALPSVERWYYQGTAYSRFAHADAGPGSPPSWRAMLKERFGVPEEEADSCEICMVNIWHPFDRPAYKDPLCLLDAGSVDLGRDVSEIPYVDVEGKSQAGVREAGLARGVNHLVGPSHDPSHRWVFCSDQRPEEAWMFKQYDTRAHLAKVCFHSSFHDPFHAAQPDATHGRRSAEFRALLTFPKDLAASKM